jgi:hypothetical protein
MSDVPVDQKLATAAPSRRPRFSLRGFIAAIGVICLVLSNAVAIRELRRVNDENQRLRDELGYLTIDDPEALYLVNLPRLEDLRWSWRVHVPRRDRFVLLVEWNDIPGDPESSRVVRSPLRAGEYVLDVAVYRSSDGKWRLLADWAEAVLSEAAAADLQNCSFSERIGRGRTFAPLPFEQLILIEQYDPEATLFGGAAGNLVAGLRVYLVDTKHVAIAPQNVSHN